MSGRILVMFVCIGCILGENLAEYAPIEEFVVEPGAAIAFNRPDIILQRIVMEEVDSVGLHRAYLQVVRRSYAAGGITAAVVFAFFNCTCMQS